MAPREFRVNYPQNDREGFRPGDDAAHRAAAALGDRADQPTIAAFSEMLAMLERVGGQFYVTAFRQKVEEDGDFETAGLVFRYETRDVSIEFFNEPTEIAGIPVTDSSDTSVRVGVGSPVDPKAAPEPTPEPEAEADREAEVAAA